MGNPFTIVDSEGKEYTVQNISADNFHIYSVQDSLGHYCEILFNGTSEVWKENWHTTTVPDFTFPISDIGQKIREQLDF